mgnify:CR=1 FL=1
MTSNEQANLEQLIKAHTTELANQFTRHVSTISESFDHKIGLIAEGHMTLHQAIQDLAKRSDERFDLLEFKIDSVAADLKATDERLNAKIDSVEERLGNKLDAVATDLEAHRKDTEAHGGIYQVKER